MRRESETEWTQILRSNWHLLTLFTLVLTCAIVLALRPQSAAKADAASAVRVDAQTTLNGSAMPEKSRWAKPTRTEEIEASVDQYTHEISDNPGSPDTPHNLYRLANLYYSNLHDYDKASLYYLALMQDYPDYEAIQTVFANLIACYEHLGQDDFKRNTLEKMKAYYGEGTEQYLFAEHELNKM